MLKIKQYIRAKSLEEAYALCQKKSNVILGGMVWLKMEDRMVGTAIDLCELGLDTIEETDTEYRIGAMVNLRTLETHEGLNRLTQNAFAHCLAPIVGVQLRNLATIGGSLWSRFGFSDPLTLLLALDARIELYHGGVMRLADWLEQPKGRDILVRVLVDKTPVQTAYLAHRNASTDLPALTCCVCRRQGRITAAVGARPMRAVLFEDSEHLLADGITEESAAAFADFVTEHADLHGNQRAGEEYRKKLCRVLVRRAALELEGNGWN